MAHRPNFNQNYETPSSPMSWLDLYPSTTQASSPVPDARLIARIDKVKETLAFVKRTIDIRSHLIALGETNGWVQRKQFDWWMRSAKEDVQLYKKLVEEVENHGSETSSLLVQTWELDATDLLQRTEDSPNRFQHKRPVKNHRGFNKHWAFDEYWGKGPGLEAEVRLEDSETPALGEEEKTELKGLTAKVKSHLGLGNTHGFIGPSLF